MKIVERIGRGGISEVFKVEDDGMFFAFKTLKPLCRDNEAAISRIKKEYQILQKLDHKNIVTCHGWANLEKREGIILEYINGKPLEVESVDRKWKGFDSMRNVICYLQGFTPAIIHNDISEKNILLDRLDQPTLIDFSSAFFLGESPILMSRKEGAESYPNDVLAIDVYALHDLVNSSSGS